MNKNAKTTNKHWDNVWVREPRMSLPSRLFVGTRNIQRLLARHLSPGMRVLEIGCAPGKILAWAAKVRKAEVSGLDYSSQGINNAKQLFNALGISGDLRCEDVFETSFKEGSFDFVFSCGVIEHFIEPQKLIDIHIKMFKPGGKALITIPNYGGIYGRLQHCFDSENLAFHNLDIMSESSLVAKVSPHLVNYVRSYPFGRMTSTLISFDKILPKRLVWVLMIFFNVVGIVQPIDIRALCPLLVLEMTRRSEES